MCRSNSLRVRSNSLRVVLITGSWQAACCVARASGSCFGWVLLRSGCSERLLLRAHFLHALLCGCVCAPGATHLVLHPGSGLAAVACVDRTVRLVDIEAARVVRRFSGHR
jgi:hypothetical protein